MYLFHRSPVHEKNTDTGGISKTFTPSYKPLFKSDDDSSDQVSSIEKQLFGKFKIPLLFTNLLFRWNYDGNADEYISFCILFNSPWVFTNS